ncbi:hypothetical protein [Halorarius litoreus]|uniref:hypothetical protein n=1 Tax=Halorarius litoreus TaxID=2962676 RepID=UPI0020CE4E43|nr:hypothetical protein [Halorarius litoreus]
MTVLIAAAGDDGRTARSLLADAGFDVERVTTLSATRVRAATVDVLVVGDLENATARDLRDALRAADGSLPPLVRLGADDAFETAVTPPFEADQLVRAVTAARQGAQYRQAVDDLYEQCREQAATDDPDAAAVTAAKRRAQEAFDETRRLGVAAPYEQLFDPRETAPEFEGFWEEPDGDETECPDGSTKESESQT